MERGHSRNLIQYLENHSWAQSWLKLAPSGICLWVGNVECFESWMDLSSFKTPLWLKENSIHCLKTPLFVFFCFSVLWNLNLQKRSHPAFCFMYLFYYISRGHECHGNLFLWLQCSEQIEKLRFNAHTEFYGKRHYSCHCRQRVELIGAWVLEPDLKAQIPVFPLLGCVTLGKVLNVSVLPQYPPLFHRNKRTSIIGLFEKISGLIHAERLKG